MGKGLLPKSEPLPSGHLSDLVPVFLPLPSYADFQVTFCGVLLHLLSPARKPAQVTQDLKRFWNSGYQQVKKKLKGRYPKHPWPDDPWKAVPTRQVKPRKR